MEELLDHLEKERILVAAIQETKLTCKSKVKKTPNYSLIRKDRGSNKGGGLAFLVHESIPFHQEKTPANLDSDKHLESLTINIPSKSGDFMIRNVYIPPTASCDQLYQPPINNIFDDLNDTSLILGDFNSHHESWYSEDSHDARGNLIVDTIAGKSFGIINEDQPTRVTADASTAPDLSIASVNIMPTTTWSVDKILNSDHLPITITVQADITKCRSGKKTYINFDKADWIKFTNETENVFANATPTDNIYKDELFFRKTIQNAAKHCIPAGRIPKVYNSIPTDAANLIDQRNELRKNDPTNPDINVLNNNINQKINEHKKTKWTEHLKSCGRGSKKLWKTIKNLNNQQQTTNNQGIYFDSKINNNPKKMANLFNSQFTPESNTKPSKRLRPTLRHLKNKPKNQKVNITISQTISAIKKSKNSKAIGPDGISPIMLKYLGINGIKYLTKLFNISVNQSQIPTIWKVGRIIPLLKPGKPSDQGTSYRPISLLSPAAKILEAILLPEICTSLNLADHQHGFRKGRSTLTALQDISEHITKGLNKKPPVDRTVSVAIDLSKAFDTVDHTQLLKDIEDLQLNDHIKRFLCAYIRGRSTYVEFRGVKSNYRKMKQGVPQGGVLSPILFNLYMSKMPLPTGTVKLISYADDSNVLNSGRFLEPVCEELNLYLNILDEWFKKRNLFISPAKSSATLFTTAPGEVKTQLPIKINNEPVPTETRPKFLGITFDCLFNFSHHTNNLKTKLIQKNNILKTLSGSTWGKDKEILLDTYKAIGQSQINYCCQIWTPNLADTHWDKIQTAQNNALRTALGCHRITSEDHLHAEAKIMPVQAHCNMLSKQFLLATQKSDHPTAIDLDSRLPSRIMKKTLKYRFGRELKRLVPEPPISEQEYKKHLKTIHTNSVRDTINSRNVNRVLGRAPPEININEKSLPRSTRSTLSQLRSGFSIFLNSYKAKIKPDQFSNICPDCNRSRHTTAHLFKCPAKPTDLKPTSLWTNPTACARFLGLQTEPDDYG